MPNPNSYTPGIIGAPQPPRPIGPPGSGTPNGTSGQTSQTTTSGGGTTFNYDPRIGQGPLPPSVWGASNRAYVRDPRQEEMSGYQLAGLADPRTSALARNATTGAMQRLAGRGGINTTMAGEAAQKAIIETATPLALQQAGAYTQAASENLGYLNQRDLANMDMENSMRQYGAQLEAARMNNEYEMARQRERLAFEGEQSELGRQYGFNMAGMENQFGQERDYRLNDFQSEADFRNYQIQQGLNQQTFDFTMMSDLYRSGNEARQNAYNSILQLFMEAPEEMDDYIGSGMMEFFNNFANQYFAPAFSNIYGPGRP